MPQPAAAVGPRLDAMVNGSKPMIDDEIDPGDEGEQKATECAIDRVPPSGGSRNEDTSYGLIGSATALEHFGEPPNGARRHPRSFLASSETSPFAPQPDEAEILASPQHPTNQQTPHQSRQGSQNIPLLQQRSKYFELLSTNSSMPTPTFQNSRPDRFSVDVGHGHPNVQTRNVQKALDETVFRSSNVFPGSTSRDSQSS